MCVIMLVELINTAHNMAPFVRAMTYVVCLHVVYKYCVVFRHSLWTLGSKLPGHVVDISEDKNFSDKEGAQQQW